MARPLFRVFMVQCTPPPDGTPPWQQELEDWLNSEQPCELLDAFPVYYKRTPQEPPNPHICAIAWLKPQDPPA